MSSKRFSTEQIIHKLADSGLRTGLRVWPDHIRPSFVLACNVFAYIRRTGMIRLATFVALCVTLSTAEARADLSVGNSVTLVVRDYHIPGHPSDNDRHVSIRFKSGSTASVEEIGNWVKVSGQTATGDTGSGWIVRKYIVSESDGMPEITFPELAWCPAKGSPNPHPSGRIRIATWNIATLHAEDGKRIFPNSPARQPVDYERIRCYMRLLDADIIAVQEIDGEEALRRPRGRRPR